MNKKRIKEFDSCLKSDNGHHDFEIYENACMNYERTIFFPTMFKCAKCGKQRLANEKYQLDSLEEQAKLATFIKWEVGIAAGMLVVAVLVALFGNNLLS
jgi:hypothetical protein